MLTLMSWMSTGLIGTVVTAILAAVEWYLWDSRYRIAAQMPAGRSYARTADRKEAIQVPSASGRDLVVTLAAPMPAR